jgi:hypothetical protein
MTLEELAVKILHICPDAIFSVNDMGEVEVSTGLMFSGDGRKLMPLPEGDTP